MKKLMALLMLAASLGLAQYQGPAKKIITGSGAPASSGCDSAGEVGNVYVRKDTAATTGSFYVCANTGVATYAWQLSNAGVPPVGLPGIDYGCVAMDATATALTATANCLLYGSNLAVPATPGVITHGGTPGVVSYGYSLSCEGGAGSAGSSERTTATGAATLTGTDTNVVPYVIGSRYRSCFLYRTTANGMGDSATTGAISGVLTGTGSFTDTGVAAIGTPFDSTNTTAGQYLANNSFVSGQVFIGGPSQDPFDGSPNDLTHFQFAVNRTYTSLSDDNHLFFGENLNFTLNPDDNVGAAFLGSRLGVKVEAGNTKHQNHLYGQEIDTVNYGSNVIAAMWGQVIDTENDADGHIPEMYGQSIDALNSSTGVVDIAYGSFIDSLGGGNTTTAIAYWVPDLADVRFVGGPAATNAYAFWSNTQGVFRIRSDNTFDSVYQSIPALYNPQFTKYTPGAANFERCVPGGQWNGNVCEIGTEKGGTATLRPWRAIGAYLLDMTYAFAGKPSYAAGQQWYCSDCQPTSAVDPTITSGGSGCQVFGQGGAQVCD